MCPASSILAPLTLPSFLSLSFPFFLPNSKTDYAKDTSAQDQRH